MAGAEWQPLGEPERVRVHDFPGDAVGKAIPYGVYDMARNEAWVSVGRDHDTPAFAVASIRQWWTMMGRQAYPHGRRALHHRRRGRQQRVSLARLEDRACSAWPTTWASAIHVSHFPPGTSKWNKIEHRLFCHITQNWRGRPLRTFETARRVDRPHPHRHGAPRPRQTRQAPLQDRCRRPPRGDAPLGPPSARLPRRLEL